MSRAAEKVPSENGQPAPNPALDEVLNKLYFAQSTGAAMQIHAVHVPVLVSYIESLERVGIAGSMLAADLFDRLDELEPAD